MANSGDSGKPYLDEMISTARLIGPKNNVQMSNEWIIALANNKDAPHILYLSVHECPRVTHT